MHTGRGVLNKLINRLPIELHIPGYQYCGPGTKLAERVARGDPGVNPLDAACKEHDIAYSQNRENVAARNSADRVLADRAWQRVFARDAAIDEKLAAYVVANTMKAKSKLGMGLKNKRPLIALAKIVRAASRSTGSNSREVIRSALTKAREAVKQAGGRKKVLVPRVLPIPEKVGGVLPFLIPLFAGLSATGALVGGAAGVAKAVNTAKAAERQLQENRRHNETMEAIALGKGLYLKPHKKGFGIHVEAKKKVQLSQASSNGRRPAEIRAGRSALSRCVHEKRFAEEWTALSRIGYRKSRRQGRTGHALGGLSKARQQRRLL